MNKNNKDKIKQMLNFPISLDGMSVFEVAELVSILLDISTPNFVRRENGQNAKRFFEFKSDELMIMIQRDIIKKEITSISLSGISFYSSVEEKRNNLLKYQYSLPIVKNDFNYSLLIRAKQIISSGNCQLF